MAEGPFVSLFHLKLDTVAELNCTIGKRGQESGVPEIKGRWEVEEAKVDGGREGKKQRKEKQGDTGDWREDKCLVRDF